MQKFCIAIFPLNSLQNQQQKMDHAEILHLNLEIQMQKFCISIFLLNSLKNQQQKLQPAKTAVSTKFIFFALCYFVFQGNFPSTSPKGAYICRGGLTKVFIFLALPAWGAYIIFGRAYTRRGLFSEFYGVYFQLQLKTHLKQRCPSDKTDGITPIPIRRARSEQLNIKFGFFFPKYHIFFPCL